MKKIFFVIFIIFLYSINTITLSDDSSSTSENETPPNKKKILKFICNPNQSDFYWGETKDTMKLMLYEDSPQVKYMNEQMEKSGQGKFEVKTLWGITEIDLEGGHSYSSGGLEYNADADPEVETIITAKKSNISPTKEGGTLIHETIYYKYVEGLTLTEANETNSEADFSLVGEIAYTDNSLTWTQKEQDIEDWANKGKLLYKGGWTKFTNSCAKSEYFVEKNSGDKSIQTFSETKLLAIQSEKAIFGEQEQKSAQLQTTKVLEEVNQKVLSEMDIVQDQYKNLNNNVDKGKNLENESKKFRNEVTKEELKTYRATSMITYYFFESQANYLASLELLFRAYDKNSEADKMKAQINYLKDSKSGENKRLKSTMQLIDNASNELKKEINNQNIKLSEESKIFYQKSLPYAFKATEYGYKAFVISTTVGKEISNSNDKIGSILGNLNEVIGFISIIPKIPGYVKNVGSTTKLIFTGAKVKKIKDEGNLGDALDELNLST